MYLAEVVEEMGENLERHGEQIEKITRNVKMMKFMVKEVFTELVEAYKKYFTLEEFLRIMHDV